ncbi:MAG: zinc metalloprotease [Planctomycetota bacterium]|jgi:hypothetical protein
MTSCKIEHRFFFVIFVLPVLAARPLFALDEGNVPEYVKVMPVFFVPQDEKGPSEKQKLKLMKHLRLARRCYKKMLKNRDTFEIEKKPPLVIHGLYPVDHYKLKNQPSRMNYEPLSEIFTKCGWNRFNCPYVLVITIMNPKEDCPGGAGRPFNRGFNGGGGLVYMPSYALDNTPWFQSSLQHELGHGFGLVHVDCYGYDQEKNRSIMSYNNDVRWKGFRPPKKPAILIPEDLRALAKNKKVFPNFCFDPTTDIPSGYKINKIAVRLDLPGRFPGQKDYRIKVETDSGETNDSSISNIVHNMIKPENSGFNAHRMWHSGISETGWVSATLTFPVPVALCKVAVHSQHSAKYHRAYEVRIQAEQQQGYVDVCRQPLTSADAYVSFPKHKACIWRFFFRAGPSKQVVIRGLRFFSSPTNEIFCPTYPYMEPPVVNKSSE